MAEPQTLMSTRIKFHQVICWWKDFSN